MEGKENHLKLTHSSDSLYIFMAILYILLKQETFTNIINYLKFGKQNQLGLYKSCIEGK